MAPMQKRAWWGLGFGLAFALAFIIVFFTMGGIEKFETDHNYRLIIDALLLGSLLGNFIIVGMNLRKPGFADERDRRIFARAPHIQWILVIVTLVAWTIALNEIYRYPGLMPTDFMYIIFMSVLIISMIGQSLGILIGYWRMSRGNGG